MTLNVKHADSIRSYWITDPMNEWKILEGELQVERKCNCSIDRLGSIVQNNSNQTYGRRGIYVGFMRNIWGHCITDNIKKLWFLRTELCQSLIKDGYELYCTILNSDTLIPNFCKLLEYLNIDSKQFRVITSDTHFDELVIPQDSLTDEHLCYKEFVDIVNEIWSKIPVDSTLPRKVYFSRSRLHNGRDFGEKYIEQVFKTLGYKIIYPELVQTSEQLSIIKSCDSFAATEGSISHNVMFCNDGAEVIIIRKTRSCNRYQYAANKLRDLKIVYVDAHLSLFNVFDNGFGPFFMYVNKNVVDFALERDLQIKKHFPKMTFLNYLCHTLYYALRYRMRILKIGDFDFYMKRFKTDFFS